MASMTDSEILRLAQAAVPDHIRPLGRIVQRPAVAAAAGLSASRGAPAKDTLIADLAKRVGATLGKTEPDSADVEFPEQTAIGLRTTVVHVRNGKVERVVKRG
jgi:hypothetical protein